MIIRTHQKLFLVVILMSFGSVSAGCAQALAEAKIARSDLERDASPQVSNGVLWELSSGNTEFALHLYQELKEEEGNLFFSPYSISSALAMTYGGARGDTEREMAQTLSFTLPQDHLHLARRALSGRSNLCLVCFA